MSKTVIVQVRLSTAFRDELQEEATQQGLTVSELIREKLNGASMPSGDAVRITSGTVAGKRTMRIEFPLPGEAAAIIRRMEAKKADAPEQKTKKGKR